MLFCYNVLNLPMGIFLGRRAMGKEADIPMFLSYIYTVSFYQPTYSTKSWGALKQEVKGGCFNWYSNPVVIAAPQRISFYFALSQSPSTQNRTRLFGEISVPILHSHRNPFFFVLRMNVKTISGNLWKI